MKMKKVISHGLEIEAPGQSAITFSKVRLGMEVATVWAWEEKPEMYSDYPTPLPADPVLHHRPQPLGSTTQALNGRNPFQVGSDANGLE